MELLNRIVKHIIALTVLFIYSIVVLAVGWISAITYEAPAIRFERSVRSAIEFKKNFPAPQPGWEQCTSDPIPGEKYFVIKLCRQTPEK